ncbi:MAG: hypothetical protein LBH01_02015 [Verrucomicrobiales bacterium]|jgi:hypothetical protein|nr:hypothetical protein [Verrucomicrobiales bacterium]
MYYPENSCKNCCGTDTPCDCEESCTRTFNYPQSQGWCKRVKCAQSFGGYQEGYNGCSVACYRAYDTELDAIGLVLKSCKAGVEKAKGDCYAACQDFPCYAACQGTYEYDMQVQCIYPDNMSRANAAGSASACARGCSGLVTSALGACDDAVTACAAPAKQRTAEANQAQQDAYTEFNKVYPACSGAANDKRNQCADLCGTNYTDCLNNCPPGDTACAVACGATRTDCNNQCTDAYNADMQACRQARADAYPAYGSAYVAYQIAMRQESLNQYQCSCQSYPCRSAAYGQDDCLGNCQAAACLNAGEQSSYYGGCGLDVDRAYYQMVQDAEAERYQCLVSGTSQDCSALYNQLYIQAARYQNVGYTHCQYANQNVQAYTDAEKVLCQQNCCRQNGTKPLASINGRAFGNYQKNIADTLASLPTCMSGCVQSCYDDNNNPTGACADCYNQCYDQVYQDSSRADIYSQWIGDTIADTVEFLKSNQFFNAPLFECDSNAAREFVAHFVDWGRSVWPSGVPDIVGDSWGYMPSNPGHPVYGSIKTAIWQAVETSWNCGKIYHPARNELAEYCYFSNRKVWFEATYDACAAYLAKCNSSFNNNCGEEEYVQFIGDLNEINAQFNESLKECAASTGYDYPCYYAWILASRFIGLSGNPSAWNSIYILDNLAAFTLNGHSTAFLLNPNQLNLNGYRPPFGGYGDWEVDVEKCFNGLWPFNWEHVFPKDVAVDN